MRSTIVKLVEENTKNKKGSTVTEISRLLEKGKNVVARELNYLVMEGTLFTIKEEEINYFHKEMYQQVNECEINQKSYESIHELNNISKKEEFDFAKLIGAQGSLMYCVEQCKAAISYPNNSLPVLLYGPTGTGKSYIAQLMYEYALNNNVISKDKPFVTLNCSEYANNPELLTANLFGHKKGAFTGADKDNVGLMEVADGGILFLDEVHCLKAECQEKLFLFMDKGIYHKVGENEKWNRSNVRLIFATTEKPEEVLLKTFLRRVPIIVTIPSLKERGLYERIQLIYSTFMQESKYIHKKIRISNFVYNMFVNYEFDGNIGELKNKIKVCCANALTSKEADYIEIHMRHLPSSMFKKKIETRKINNNSDERMIDIQDLYKKDEHSSKILKMFETILESVNEGNNEKLLNTCFTAINKYYDQIMYDEKNIKDSKSSFIVEQAREIILNDIKRYDIQISNNDLILLFKFLENTTRNPLVFHQEQANHLTENEVLKERLENIILREMMIAEEIVEKINHDLDLFLGNMFTCVLALHLKKMNNSSRYHRRLGIIMAHGYSTASSIANATNALLDEYIFEAIDMPIQVTTKEVVETLNTYLMKVNHYEELVFLVDMGSLEEIYKGIQPYVNANIGIINNITTKLALEIGNELRNNTPLEEILKTACEANSFRYKIIEKKTKEDVIVCACASGLGTAEKIKDLLLSSLPGELPMNIITYDYNHLIDYNGRKELFDNYNVVAVIGTINPDIEDLLFLPIEELIVDQDIEKFEKVFNPYLDKEKIEVFKLNLLKNFSLTNIMEHLTILNPTKLLEHVAKALDDFQQYYGITIRNNTCVGLYVHTCCMIERLVTSRSFDNYVGTKKLLEEEKEFVSCIKKAFVNVEKYYGVEIPIDEIGYIYDYISNNS